MYGPNTESVKRTWKVARKNNQFVRKTLKIKMKNFGRKVVTSLSYILKGINRKAVVGISHS